MDSAIEPGMYVERHQSNGAKMLRDDANVISHAGGRQEEIGYLQTYWWRKNVALDLRVDGGGTSSFGAADETDKSIGSPSHQLPFRANRWKDGLTDARTDGREWTDANAADTSERVKHTRARATCSSSPLPPLSFPCSVCCSG